MTRLQSSAILIALLTVTIIAAADDSSDQPGVQFSSGTSTAALVQENAAATIGRQAAVYADELNARRGQYAGPQLTTETARGITAGTLSASANETSVPTQSHENEPVQVDAAGNEQDSNNNSRRTDSSCKSHSIQTCPQPGNPGAEK